MQSRSRMRTWLELTGVHTVRLLLRPLPLRLVPVPGEVLGWLLFSVFRLQRRQTLRNLELAFGQQFGPCERKRLGQRCYRHFGGVITEFLSLPRLSRHPLERIVTLEQSDPFAEALEPGRGVLLVSGHLGNWELLAPLVSSLGHRIHLYVGEQHNRFVDEAINNIRGSLGVGTIPKRTAMRGMIRALRANGVVGMLPDQHFSRNRHFVRFFGRPVSAPPGAATLVRHTGARVVFAEMIRVGRFRYRAAFRPLPVPPPSGDEELDLLRVTQAIMDALEEAVRRHPEQYFWMHRRWRTPPPPERLTETNRAFLAQGEAAAPEAGPDPRAATP